MGNLPLGIVLLLTFKGYTALPANPECASLDNIISHIQAPPGGTIQCHRNDICTMITCTGTAPTGDTFSTSASLQHCSSPAALSVSVVVPALDVNYRQTVRHNDMYEIPGLQGDVPILGTQEHIQGYLQVTLQKKDEHTLSIGVKLLGGTRIFGMMVYPLVYDVIPEQNITVPTCRPVHPTPEPLHPSTKQPRPPLSTTAPTQPSTTRTVEPKPPATTTGPNPKTSAFHPRTSRQPSTTSAPPTVRPSGDHLLQCQSLDQLANNVTSLMPTLATITCKRNAACTGLTCQARTYSDTPVHFAVDIILHGCDDPQSIDVTINSVDVGLDHTQTVTHNGTYPIQGLKVPIAGYTLPAVYEVHMARVPAGMDLKVVVGLSNGPVQYSFFQLGEQTVTMSACPSGTASRKHSEAHHSTMVLVGAVVGAVVGVALLVVLGLLIRRWRKPYSLSVYGDMQVLMSASNEDFEPSVTV